jgi:hypothetical protein
MSRRRIATSALLALACTAAGSTATASAAAPSAGASGTRTRVARPMKEDWTGLKFTNRLSESGKQVGTEVGSCRYVQTGTKLIACGITLRLNDGTLVLSMRAGLTSPSQRMTVVSGTGAYAGAHGSAIAKARGGTTKVLTLHLT